LRVERRIWARGAGIVLGVRVGVGGGFPGALQPDGEGAALAERSEGDEFVAEGRGGAPGKAGVFGAGEPAGVAVVAAGVIGLKPLGGEGAVGADGERGEVSPVLHEDGTRDDGARGGERGGVGREGGVPEGAGFRRGVGGGGAVVGEVQGAVGGVGETGALGVGRGGRGDRGGVES